MYSIGKIEDFNQIESLSPEQRAALTTAKHQHASSEALKAFSLHLIGSIGTKLALARLQKQQKLTLAEYQIERFERAFAEFDVDVQICPATNKLDKITRPLTRAFSEFELGMRNNDSESAQVNPEFSSKLPFRVFTLDDVDMDVALQAEPVDKQIHTSYQVRVDLVTGDIGFKDKECFEHFCKGEIYTPNLKVLLEEGKSNNWRIVLWILRNNIRMHSAGFVLSAHDKKIFTEFFKDEALKKNVDERLNEDLRARKEKAIHNKYGWHTNLIELIKYQNQPTDFMSLMTYLLDSSHTATFFIPAREPGEPSRKAKKAPETATPAQLDAPVFVENFAYRGEGIDTCKMIIVRASLDSHNLNTYLHSVFKSENNFTDDAKRELHEHIRSIGLAKLLNANNRMIFDRWGRVNARVDDVPWVPPNPAHVLYRKVVSRSSQDRMIDELKRVSRYKKTAFDGLTPLQMRIQIMTLACLDAENAVAVNYPMLLNASTLIFTSSAVFTALSAIVLEQALYPEDTRVDAKLGVSFFILLLTWFVATFVLTPLLPRLQSHEDAISQFERELEELATLLKNNSPESKGAEFLSVVAKVLFHFPEEGLTENVTRIIHSKLGSHSQNFISCASFIMNISPYYPRYYVPVISSLWTKIFTGIQRAKALQDYALPIFCREGSKYAKDFFNPERRMPFAPPSKDEVDDLKQRLKKSHQAFAQAIEQNNANRVMACGDRYCEYLTLLLMGVYFSNDATLRDGLREELARYRPTSKLLIDEITSHITNIPASEGQAYNELATFMNFYARYASPDDLKRLFDDFIKNKDSLQTEQTVSARHRP